MDRWAPRGSDTRRVRLSLANLLHSKAKSMLVHRPLKTRYMDDSSACGKLAMSTVPVTAESPVVGIAQP